MHDFNTDDDSHTFKYFCQVSCSNIEKHTRKPVKTTMDIAQTNIKSVGHSATLDKNVQNT